MRGNSELNLRDKFNYSDTVKLDNVDGKLRVKHPSPYTRTQILIHDELGNLIGEFENQVVLGGALYTLEKVFNVESPLKVDYLNDIMNIATTGPAVTQIYGRDNCVCLFGVGIGGCGESYKAVKEVKYYERELLDMIPFRMVDGELPEQIKNKYWFKTNIGGKNAYYLKEFDQKPTIKVLWKDAEGDEDGSEVQEGVHNTARTEQIETFVEIILRIDKDDIREYFEENGDIEGTRINTFGLFTGVKSTLADGTQDYKQVKLFSKLNIPNEMLAISKAFTITYRIYAS